MRADVTPMLWRQTKRADTRGAALADRHYSRQSVGSQQFTPPGRVLVLITAEADAVWSTSWPFAEFVHRAQFPGAWVCSLFRNESAHLSSLLICQAVAATRAVFGEPPADGMVTMVDPSKVRHKRDPGRCFLRAGFVRVGVTKERGLIVLRLAPEDMPAPQPPLGMQMSLELTA